MEFLHCPRILASYSYVCGRDHDARWAGRTYAMSLKGHFYANTHCLTFTFPDFIGHGTVGMHGILFYTCIPSLIVRIFFFILPLVFILALAQGSQVLPAAYAAADLYPDIKIDAARAPETASHADPTSLTGNNPMTSISANADDPTSHAANLTGLAHAFAELIKADKISYLVLVFRDDDLGRAFNATLVDLLPPSIVPHPGVKYDAQNANASLIAQTVAGRFHPETSTAVVLFGSEEIADIVDQASTNPKLLAAKWYANDQNSALLSNTDSKKKFLKDTRYTIGIPAGSPTDVANMTHMPANYTLMTYTGDRFVTTAVYSPYADLRVLTDTSMQGTPHGLLSGITGDWNGDGHYDAGTVGIAHNGHQVFSLTNILDNQRTQTQFTGALGATFQYAPGTLKPLVGDWDGDGDDDVGAVGITPDSSKLHFTLSANGTSYDTVFAGSLDRTEPYDSASLAHIVGDWNGDGTDDIGFAGVSASGEYVYEAYVIANGSPAMFESGVLASKYDIYLGGTVDPLVGDWDGDNNDDFGFTGILPSGLRQFVLYVNGDRIFDKFTGDYRFYAPGSFTHLVGDWDGDGDDDIGTVGLENNLQFFTLTTNLEDFDVFLISAVGDSSYYLPGRLVMLVDDWDGDGDDDIGAVGIDANGNQHFLLSPYNPDTGFTTRYSGILGNAKDYFVPRSATYDVAITNHVKLQPLVFPMLVAHDDRISVFAEDRHADIRLKFLAENGITDPHIASFSLSKGVANVASTASLTANQTRTIQITTDGNHPYLSLASMLACTNDGFVGLDSVLLADATFYPRIYDAGTEANTEDYADIPPACQSLTNMTSGKAGSSIFDPAIREYNPISIHNGIEAKSDLLAGITGHDWADLPIRIDIRRTH